MSIMGTTRIIEDLEKLLKKREWIIEQLEAFEKKYNMKTTEFISAWKEGLIPEPDDPDTHGDFMVWEGLFDELTKVEEEIRRRIKH